MHLHPPGELLSDIIRRQGFYSKRDLELYDLVLREGDTFIDGGANIGWYSLYAAEKVGRTGHIIAIEPEPKNLALLAKNVKENTFENIQIIDGALGEESGLKLSLFTSDQNSGDHFVKASAELTPELRRGMVETHSLSLDDIIANSNLTPRLIKIDIQGAEPEALLGLKKTLQAEKPLLLVEFSPGLIARRGGSPFDIFAFIEKNKYVPLRLAGDNTTAPLLSPVSIQMLLDFTRDYRETDIGWDLFLVPADRLAEFQKHVG